MQTAYHTLELFEAPGEQVRERIWRWLAGSGFRVSSAAPSEGPIRAERGSALGVTDAQTGRVMEVLVRSWGQVTAVSIHHHTTRFGPVAGAMTGELLRDEVHALLAALSETAVANC